ncbi:hypothetical protein Pmani_007756 [Petrolisthes manimaculis]|uniref:B3/B4 tRNA-binding domain-containing protein n=1 Tax=Petrolisthes manimaculis TaxID=1843537 RepID=A0AAE1Q7N5_9EUCA|nr:hypothetical protein Pmani_007756 [Petrolisthes manimaculis]
MWPEVRQVLDEKRYELVLTGEDVNNRILANQKVNKKQDNKINKEKDDDSEDVTKKGIADSEDVHNTNKGITDSEDATKPQLDPNIYQLQHINFLRVSRTPLTNLGVGVSNLINLLTLNLQENKLKNLPESIEKLEKLKFLDVSGNLLESLPPGIAKISSLTSVNVNNNKLTLLPDFEGCVNLSVLDARHNVLEEFPGICYESLVHLSEVSLGSNCLTNVPGDINVLPTLKLLGLSENKVNIVPGELATCPKLKDLDLKGNPLSDRRLKKLVESDRCIPRQVLDYIKQHCPLMKGEEGKKGKKGKGGKGKQKEKDEIDELCDEIQVLNQRDDSLTVQVDVEVKKVRPYIVCCVLKNLDLKQDNLRKFIDLQTKLHEGVCEKRLAATIATHDLKKVQGPVRYQARPPEDIHIHPLVRGKVVSARQLYQGLKQDAHNQRKQQKRNAPTGIHKYLHIVEKWTLWPCLVDVTGTVISLPPLTNSENTKISSDTTDILVEVTSGTSLTKAKEVMNALVFMTHKLKLNNNNTTAAEGKKEGEAEGKKKEGEAEGKKEEEVAEGIQGLQLERKRVILKVEQVKVEEEDTGDLATLSEDINNMAGLVDVKTQNKPSISQIFTTMEYGPALEDHKVAQAWLDSHDGKFGHFINNKWVLPDDRCTYATRDPCTDRVLATTIQGTQQDVDQAVGAAREAYVAWSQLSGHGRARHLYSIARHIQKHSRLLAVIEALDNGKTVRETRDCDVPLVARHLYYHAGWAQLKHTHMQGWKSIGVVGAIVPWNFPVMLLAWKVCPALAMGNTVVLKPATSTRLSALLFAEICAEAGLPAGVFNVVTGGGGMGTQLATHHDVDKVAFTGSTEVGQILRRATAGTGKKLSLELGGKSPVVVFESADLDSAVEGVVDAIWFNQGQVCSAGSRLLVQESVFARFISKLKHRMSSLRLGSSMDKTADMGAVIDDGQRLAITKYVDEARRQGAQVHQVDCPRGCYFPPTLITGVSTTSPCVTQEIFGPVLVAMSFRTAKEGIALANNSIYGLGASVFTEKITLAIEVAKMIKAGAVWVNCHNMFDAAAGFGGYKQSGYGRDGGKEGLYEYIKPCWEGELRFNSPNVNLETFGATYMADGPSITPATPKIVSGAGILPRVDRTYKLYYGGTQKRPDANYCRVINDATAKAYALVGESNRKDVRNAVEAAGKAQSGWERRSGFNRSQILYYIGENLEQRREEFITHLTTVMGCTTEEAGAEVDGTVERLFHWAALCDKHGGEVQETNVYGTVLRVHEAVGVVGVACPDQYPLLAFVSLVAPAVARGSTVVAIPSQSYPTLALALYQVLETSDLPAGVINILTGNTDHITKYLTEHQDIQAMWYFGSLAGSKFVEHTSAVNLKRTWVNYGQKRNWADQEEGAGQEFLYQATQVKNVWLTAGDIFAN